MKEHPGRYATPSLVTFDQITFGSPDSGKLEAARRALATGADPQALGDERMLLPHLELYPIDLVQRDFGPDFARSILKVGRGRWEGPVKSGYGLHLVRVQQVVPGSEPRFADVRAAVARDYEQDRRSRALDGAYRRLREHYRVEYLGRWKSAQSK